MLQPRFTADLAKLATHGFSHRALTFWGIIAFFVIEGTGFVMAVASYFFLMNQEQAWPPPPSAPPDLLAGTLFTIVMLLSEIPNTLVKKAARAGDVPSIRLLLPVMVAIGAVLLVIRGFEFNRLNCRWTDDAYSSIIWALLVLHASHLITDWGDTVVLAALMYTPMSHEGRRWVDVDENSLYWRYVWRLWIPIYLMIYWVPRL